jgi:hypothetical protein
LIILKRQGQQWPCFLFFIPLSLPSGLCNWNLDPEALKNDFLRGQLFIGYRVQYPDACIVIPAKAGIQKQDASVGWHDKYLAACCEDALLCKMFSDESGWITRKYFRWRGLRDGLLPALMKGAPDPRVVSRSSWQVISSAYWGPNLFLAPIHLPPPLTFKIPCQDITFFHLLSPCLYFFTRNTAI